MAKELVQTRTEKRMKENLIAIGKEIGLSEHDVYREAFSDYIKKHYELLHLDKKQMKFHHLQEYVWYELDRDVFVRWKNDKGIIYASMIEYTSDKWLTLSNAFLPKTFSELKETIEKTTADIHIDESGIVTTVIKGEVLKETSFNFEKIIIAEYLRANGDEEARRKVTSDAVKKELLHKWGVY